MFKEFQIIGMVFLNWIENYLMKAYERPYHQYHIDVRKNILLTSLRSLFRMFFINIHKRGQNPKKKCKVDSIQSFVSMFIRYHIIHHVSLESLHGLRISLSLHSSLFIIHYNNRHINQQAAYKIWYYKRWNKKVLW